MHLSTLTSHSTADRPGRTEPAVSKRLWPASTLALCPVQASRVRHTNISITRLISSRFIKCDRMSSMRKSFARRMGVNFQRLGPTWFNSIGVPAVVTKQHTSDTTISRTSSWQLNAQRGNLNYLIPHLKLYLGWIPDLQEIYSFSSPSYF